MAPRQARYANKPKQRFSQQQLERHQLTGHGAFVDEIERRIGVRVESRKLGRPRGINKAINKPVLVFRLNRRCQKQKVGRTKVDKFKFWPSFGWLSLVTLIRIID